MIEPKFQTPITNPMGADGSVLTSPIPKPMEMKNMDEGPKGWKHQWDKPWGDNVTAPEVPTQAKETHEFFETYRNPDGSAKKHMEEM